jgi:DNA-directed RNA polymerase specialized sigma24 family protein
MTNFASTSETLSAFKQLSDDELLALRYGANSLIHGTMYSEPADLLHEALYRSLDGRRNWPKHIAFGAFLLMTMRSIVSTEHKKTKRFPHTAHSLDDIAVVGADSANSSPSAEDTVIAMQMLESAARTVDATREALEGDIEALQILSGMMSGMTSSEMCRDFKITKKAFDAARHRVMRRITKNAQRGGLH